MAPGMGIDGYTGDPGRFEKLVRDKSKSFGDYVNNQSSSSRAIAPVAPGTEQRGLIAGQCALQPIKFGAERSGVDLKEHLPLTDFIALGDRHPGEHARYERLHGDGPIGLDLPVRGDDKRQRPLLRRDRGNDRRGARRTLLLFAGSKSKQGNRREREQSARGIYGEPARGARRQNIIWHSQGRAACRKRRSTYDSKADKRHGGCP
jgi:hypothetical protein